MSFLHFILGSICILHVEMTTLFKKKFVVSTVNSVMSEGCLNLTLAQLFILSPCRHMSGPTRTSGYATHVSLPYARI